MDTIGMGHTRALIAIRERALQVLERQQAEFGALHVPAHIVTQIEQIRAEIGRLRKRLQQSVIRTTMLATDRPARFPGLMLLIGPGRIDQNPLAQAALDAIAYHHAPQKGARLKHCWLVGSAGEHGSLRVMRAIQRRCEQRRITVHPWTVEDALSVQESYDLISWLYAHEVADCQLSEGEMIADLTGATKPMSIGMVLACGEHWPMQYMVRQPSGPSLPILLRYTLRADGNARV